MPKNADGDVFKSQEFLLGMKRKKPVGAYGMTSDGIFLLARLPWAEPF